MPPLPVISGKKLLKTLQRFGYVAIRQRGSHVFLSGLNQRLSTVIPVHGNEDLGKGILKSILDDLELSVEDLLRMMQ